MTVGWCEITAPENSPSGIFERVPLGHHRLPAGIGGIILLWGRRKENLEVNETPAQVGPGKYNLRRIVERGKISCLHNLDRDAKST